MVSVRMVVLDDIRDQDGAGGFEVSDIMTFDCPGELEEALPFLAENDHFITAMKGLLSGKFGEGAVVKLERVEDP